MSKPLSPRLCRLAARWLARGEPHERVARLLGLADAAALEPLLAEGGGLHGLALAERHLAGLSAHDRHERALLLARDALELDLEEGSAVTARWLATHQRLVRALYGLEEPPAPPSPQPGRATGPQRSRKAGPPDSSRAAPPVAAVPNTGPAIGTPAQTPTAPAALALPTAPTPRPTPPAEPPLGRDWVASVLGADLGRFEAICRATDSALAGLTDEPLTNRPAPIGAPSPAPTPAAAPPEAPCFADLMAGEPPPAAVAEEEHVESLQEATDRLLAGGAPRGLDDLDLADAIVALRLPKAPRYTRGLDLDAIAALLESRPLHPDTLNRLAGTDFMRMAEAAEAGRGRSPPLPAGEGPAQGP